MRLVRTLAPACLAALVAGCATTVEDVRSQGERSEHALRLPPEQAAGCVSRNADAFNDLFHSTVRALPGPKQYEVIVRIDSGGMGQVPMGVAEVLPQGPGARMTLWTSPLLPDFRAAEFRDRVTAGC